MPLTVLVMLALLAPQPKATRTPRPTPTPTPYPTAKMEKLLAGTWECVSVCPEESVGFQIQGTQRPFASWLRDRPAIMGGSWQLEEGRITIRKSDAVIHTWDIVTLNRVRLEVKGAEPDKPNAVFRRSMR
jgi:hypothetical protein